MVSAEPFSHATGTLRCLQKKMATYRLTDLCPCGETQTMSHIVESCPLTNERWLISATLCGWRRCFVADKLCLMTRIREEEEDQDGGRGCSILFPVSHLLISLPSEGQSLWVNQISSTYLNWWLRYNYFRFWKTDVHRIGNLLSISNICPKSAHYSASGYRILSKSKHSLQKYDVISILKMAAETAINQSINQTNTTISNAP